MNAENQHEMHFPFQMHEMNISKTTATGEIEIFYLKPHILRYKPPCDSGVE